MAEPTYTYAERYTGSPRHWHVMYMEFGRRNEESLPTTAHYMDEVFASRRWAMAEFNQLVGKRGEDVVTGGPVPCYARQCMSRPRVRM